MIAHRVRYQDDIVFIFLDRRNGQRVCFATFGSVAARGGMFPRADVIGSMSLFPGASWQATPRLHSVSL